MSFLSALAGLMPQNRVAGGNPNGAMTAPIQMSGAPVLAPGAPNFAQGGNNGLSGLLQLLFGGLGNNQQFYGAQKGVPTSPTGPVTGGQQSNPLQNIMHLFGGGLGQPARPVTTGGTTPGHTEPRQNPAKGQSVGHLLPTNTYAGQRQAMIRNDMLY